MTKGLPERELTFDTGPILLESGETLNDAVIVYKTFGKLDNSRSNAILVNTHFGGTHENSLYLVGDDMALDPKKYFIVVVNLMGNGMSSSPSHGLGAKFPKVSMADNVKAQSRLLEELYEITDLALVVGHSMGGVASYHWAALFPDRVRRAAPICGSAKISTHNYVFLEGMKGILTSDPAWDNGNYTKPPVMGLRTMARAWAAWPPSSHFYRERSYETLGYESLEDFLSNYWELTYCGLDANDLLTQIATWQSADIGRGEVYNGDFFNALGSIKAKTYVMPCKSDAYFPPEDSVIETDVIPDSKLMPIESHWGHWAGSGRNPKDTAFINTALAELLEWDG